MLQFSAPVIRLLGLINIKCSQRRVMLQGRWYEPRDTNEAEVDWKNLATGAVFLPSHELGLKCYRMMHQTLTTNTCFGCRMGLWGSTTWAARSVGKRPLAQRLPPGNKTGGSKVVTPPREPDRWISLRIQQYSIEISDLSADASRDMATIKQQGYDVGKGEWEWNRPILASNFSTVFQQGPSSTNL